MVFPLLFLLAFTGVRCMQMPSTCGISPLGFQCYKQVCSNIAMHWTFGEISPDKECKYPNGPDSNATDAGAEFISIALVTDLDGYVALSLPQVLGQMSPADSVIAFGPNQVNLSIHPYFLNSYDAPEGIDERPSILYPRVNYDAQSHQLTACFTRPILGSGSAGSKISLSSNGSITGFNFAAGKFIGPNHPLHQHEMDAGHLCAVSFPLLAVAVPGGETVDPSGPSYTVSAVICHGIMMMLAWLLLLPLGILAARHRWIFPPPPLLPSPSHKPALATWFVVHRALQFSGAVLFSVAFLLPWVAFNHGNHDHGEDLSFAMALHGPLGITIAVMVYSQVLLAFLRPKPDALPVRHYWNNQHWWTGRILILIAFVQICLGIQLLKEAEGMNQAPWIAVLVLLLLLVVGAFVFLEVRSGFWHRYSAVRQSDTLREASGASILTLGNNSLGQPLPVGTHLNLGAGSEDGFEDATPLLSNNASATHHRSIGSKE